MPDADESAPTSPRPGLSGEDRRWLRDDFQRSQAENRSVTVKSIHLAFLAFACFVTGVFEGMVARYIYSNRISTASAAIGDADIGLLTRVAFWAFTILAVTNVGIGLLPPMPSRLTLWMWLRITPLGLSAVIIVLAAKWYLKR